MNVQSIMKILKNRENFWLLKKTFFLVFWCHCLQNQFKLAFNNVKIESEFQPNRIKNKKVRFYGQILTLLAIFHIFSLFYREIEILRKIDFICRNMF